jgi:hypothetical protein
LDSDANATIDRHVARIGSRGVEVEMEEKDWGWRIIYITRRTEVSCHDCRWIASSGGAEMPCSRTELKKELKCVSKWLEPLGTHCAAKWLLVCCTSSHYVNIHMPKCVLHIVNIDVTCYFRITSVDVSNFPTFMCLNGNTKCVKVKTTWFITRRVNIYCHLQDSIRTDSSS